MTATPNPTADPGQDQGPNVTDLPDTGGGPIDATQRGFGWTIAALLGLIALSAIRFGLHRHRVNTGRR